MNSLIFDFTNKLVINKNPTQFELNQKITINTIPHDVMLLIFSMLDVSDLCHNVSLVNKEWYQLTKNENFWKALCQKHFLFSNHYPKEKSQETWKLVYKFLAKQRHTCLFSDGRIAEGFFKGGKLSQGILKLPSGTIAQGKFQNDVLHGNGTITYANGVIKRGQFKNHNLHGRGTILEADGTVKMGKFQYGKLNGRGSIVHPDTRTEQGIFKNNVLKDMYTREKRKNKTQDQLERKNKTQERLMRFQRNRQED